MRGAATSEMEYLGAIRGRNKEDAKLARELGRRLEALRRYDQRFCDADWQPRVVRTGCETVRKESET
jgi:hypothetical protein